MHASEVTDGIFCLSANIGSNILFEGIWPLPEGASMNSYVVKGRDVALIDGVSETSGNPEALFSQLDRLGVKIEEISYVVINHTEPDHSGWLKAFLKLNPKAEVLITAKGLELAKAFFGMDLPCRVIKSGDSVDLGNGKQLVFEEIPNVHWPDTMAAYEPATGTLFCCDAFGSFGAVEEGALYDDQLDEQQLQAYEEEALRYYANIVARFSSSVVRAIEKVRKLDVRIVAPGHGPVWRKDPERIIRLYEKLAAYAQGPAKAQVTLLWSSMYGNTAKVVEPLVQGLVDEGVAVVVHQVPQSHVSNVLAATWESTGVVLAMPTYEYKMFPPMATVIDELGRKTVKGKLALRVGSFGWSGGAQKELEEITERQKMSWTFLEPVEFQGNPSEETLQLIRQRAGELARQVKEKAL
ncbi:MAG: FprA family A-type flavoprotein [Syntrophotaleaceae bacterium]